MPGLKGTRVCCNFPRARQRLAGPARFTRNRIAWVVDSFQEMHAAEIHMQKDNRRPESKICTNWRLPPGHACRVTPARLHARQVV